MHTLNREFIQSLFDESPLNGKLMLENNKIVLAKTGKVIIDLQEDDYLKVGREKILYRVENLDCLSSIFQLDFKSRIFYGGTTMMEFRTGKVGRDYPDLSIIRDWMESIDNPLFDDVWCSKNNITVNYSEFLDGISFIILAKDQWILDNIPEMCERRYEKFIVKDDIGAKYCGRGGAYFLIPPRNRYSCIRVLDEDWEKLKE